MALQHTCAVMHTCRLAAGVARARAPVAMARRPQHLARIVSSMSAESRCGKLDWVALVSEDRGESSNVSWRGHFFLVLAVWSSFAVSLGVILPRDVLAHPDWAHKYHTHITAARETLSLYSVQANDVATSVDPRERVRGGEAGSGSYSQVLASGYPCHPRRVRAH